MMIGCFIRTRCLATVRIYLFSALWVAAGATIGSTALAFRRTNGTNPPPTANHGGGGNDGGNFGGLFEDALPEDRSNPALWLGKQLSYIAANSLLFDRLLDTDYGFAPTDDALGVVFREQILQMAEPPLLDALTQTARWFRKSLTQIMPSHFAVVPRIEVLVQPNYEFATHSVAYEEFLKKLPDTSDLATQRDHHGSSTYPHQIWLSYQLGSDPVEGLAAQLSIDPKLTGGVQWRESELFGAGSAITEALLQGKRLILDELIQAVWTSSRALDGEESTEGDIAARIHALSQAVSFFELPFAPGNLRYIQGNHEGESVHAGPDALVFMQLAMHVQWAAGGAFAPHRPSIAERYFHVHNFFGVPHAPLPTQACPEQQEVTERAQRGGSQSATHEFIVRHGDQIEMYRGPSIVRRIPSEPTPPDRLREISAHRSE